MIALSIAHSSKDRGAYNAKYKLTEYAISCRASRAASEMISSAGFASVVIDCGALDDFQYAHAKPDMVNGIKPRLALEIHCNSSVNTAANYGTVIYHPSSKAFGLPAAQSVAKAMADGFGTHKWPSKGAVPAEKRLFFLDGVNCPSVIVEGLFLSNDTQAEFLASANGPETYGLLVAEGIISWLRHGKT
jgi:N-acetylmuramoyl-L-alanine amidase